MKTYLDYHIHPNYSIDAEDYSIYDYCHQAVTLGLNEICFTTHLEVNPVRRHLDWFVRVRGQRHPMEELSWLDHYFNEIQVARRQFGPQGLKIKVGLEVGYEPGYERSIEKVLNNFPFDFVLGSVHCLKHHAISSWKESSRYFPAHTAEEVCREYFNVFKRGSTN